MSIPRILVIAGSDSSGGAGLEADQKVLAAHGCYAMTATTALTAQNTLGVQDVHITPPAFVAKQINACLDDIRADVIKIGMLASAETVRVVADTIALHSKVPIVLDPVMVATSGAQLLPKNAIRLLREKLLSRTAVLTPNIPEAILLLEDAKIEFSSPSSVDDLKALALKVHGLGPKAVLVKGGHLPLKKSHVKAEIGALDAIVVDVLFDGEKFILVESEHLQSKNTHGTGCSLASAIAANLGRHQPLHTAVRNACQYVEAGIKTSRNIGSGNGPINHFHSVQILPFAPGRFIEYLLERPDLKTLWHAYTQHEFVQLMGKGILSVDKFKAYLIQDYLYLTHFARTNALAAYKSKNISSISASAQIVVHIEREMSMHLSYCKEFGLSQAEIEKSKESLACVAYSRYVLDIGQSEDWLALQMALAPCLLGYAVAAQRIYAEPTGKREGNLYWRWVENYIAGDYREAVKKGSAMLESHIVQQSPARIEELVEIFIRATEMEVQFWELGAHSD